MLVARALKRIIFNHEMKQINYLFILLEESDYTVKRRSFYFNKFNLVS